jgi:transcriptional regulator with XRE-family HTH domain
MPMLAHLLSHPWYLSRPSAPITPAEMSRMPRSLPALLYQSRRLLDVGSQGEFGELLGSSQRSGQRWERGEALPTPEQLDKLAALVFPNNKDLAVEIAAATGKTIEQLGLVRAAPAPAPATAVAPPRPLPDPIHIVDTVVCAAAEAIQIMPDAIRPALRAAFRRAHLAGLTVEAVDRALSGRITTSTTDGDRASTKNDRGASKKTK